MCIGVPMLVVEPQGDFALCRRRDGTTATIDLRLIGPQAAGSWILTFLDSARSTLEAEEAGRIDDALSALELALRGENVDHLFADLVGREPPLPDFLQARKTGGAS